MGVCASCFASCLGRSDESERAPLISSNPHHTSYYSYGAPPSPTTADGPFTGHTTSSGLHEREYLDRLVAQTSENLIDIFAPPVMAGPQPGPGGGSMSVTPNTRGEWYRAILERVGYGVGEMGVEVIGGVGEGEGVVVGDARTVGEEERRWLEGVVGRGEEAVRECGKVREVGKLVVGLDLE